MPEAAESSRIVIAGAGSIGCHVGACLTLAGRDALLLARPRIAQALRDAGLRVTDLDGMDRVIEPARLAVTDDPATALSGAGIVLLTTKTSATVEMTRLIDRFAPPGCAILSLQNGTGNVEHIHAALTTKRPVHACMVAYNVTMDETARPLRVHRGTDGGLVLDAAAGGRADLLRCDGLSVAESHDMAGVLWGKLMLNLNNALNALSGLPLAAELSDRRWRGLLARQMDEALAAMSASGIRPAKLAGAPPRLLPAILRLPDWLFRRVARRMMAIDPQARSSMWDDLEKRRPTEVDEFQGAILRLAERAGTAAPLSARIVEEVRAAERANAGPPALDPSDLAPR